MSDYDQREQHVHTQINADIVTIHSASDDEAWESLLVLDEFLLSQDEVEKTQAVFTPARGYNFAKDILSRKSILWIIGPSGIGKRTLALSLALEYPERDIYIIPRFISWSQVAETGIHNAIILFPDTLGAVGFERTNVEPELKYLERLITNRNQIIVTTPGDIFSDASKNVPRLAEWVSENTRLFSLDGESYTSREKISLFRKTVIFAYNTGIISDNQQRWAFDLFETSEDRKSTNTRKAQNRDFFNRLIVESWLPIDIARFVIDSLPTADRPSDILELLRRDANIDNRIHSWFVDLDDSTRCFILSLALFAGDETISLWNRYKEITGLLKQLDPNLAMLPLGILRYRSAPHVTKNGMIDFVNPRIHKAVVNEISKNYREYFMELTPLLKKWSIPELPSSLTRDERSTRLADTEDIRNSIARIVGEVGRYGIDEVLNILDAWASNPFGNIGKTAGIALRETVVDPVAAQNSLRLLHDWSVDFSSPVARFHRWSAASALWRVSSSKSRFDLTEFSLRHLQKLAKDPDEYVVSSAAHAFRMMGRTIPLEKMSLPLTRLAGEDEPFTRQQIAFAVDEVARHDREGVINLLDEWSSTGDDNITWTATYALLVTRNIPKSYKYSKLVDLLEVSPSIFLNALFYSLQDKDSKGAWMSLVQLAKEPPSGYRMQLIARLTDITQQYSTSLDGLYSIFQSSANPIITSIPQAVANEIQARIVKEQQRIAQFHRSKSFIDEIIELIKSFYTWLQS